MCISERLNLVCWENLHLEWSYPYISVCVCVHYTVYECAVCVYLELCDRVCPKTDPSHSFRLSRCFPQLDESKDFEERKMIRQAMRDLRKRRRGERDHSQTNQPHVPSLSPTSNTFPFLSVTLYLNLISSFTSFFFFLIHLFVIFPLWFHICSCCLFSIIVLF